MQYQKVQNNNCLKMTETSVILIVFNGVICDVSAYSVTVLLGPWLNNTEVYFTLFISIQNHTIAG